MPDKSYISGNVENGPIFDILVGNLLAYRPEEWGWSEQDYQKISSDFGVAENDLYHLPVANYVILNYPDNLLPSGVSTDVEDYRLQVYSIQSDELTKYLLLYIGNRIYKATITDIGQTPNWEDITEYGADGLKIISFHIGDNAPSDTSKIWIDTSKLASDGYITLFFYDAASGRWKNYYVNGLMDKSIYDTQNKNTDPFLYVMDQIEAIIGDYAEFIRHKNNELTLIHVTSEEKEYYNTQLISKEDLTNMFSPAGVVYEELLTYIKNSVRDKFNIDQFTDDINNIKEKLQNHTDNHITAEKVTSWINKADGNHTHNQDGRVTIHGTDIKGDPYTSDQLPDNIKERVTVVNSEDERLALTIDQVQNGDAVCVEDGDGNLVWYRVIDDTKLGAEYAEESKWKETTDGLSDRAWASICYGNGKYVAVAYDSNTFAYSSDGINWTETSNGLSYQPWKSIFYGNGKFVAIVGKNLGSNTFAYSTDGINWTETSNGLSNREWHDICYGNGKYVAVAYDSNTFAYSTDGINWKETSNGLNKRRWNSICYGKDKFVVVSGLGPQFSNTFAYSYDGITWTETSNGLIESAWISICYGNEKFVAITNLDKDMNPSAFFAYSTDGINWNIIDHHLPEVIWSTICYFENKFIVCSYLKNMEYEASTIFAYSTDGINWNSMDYNLGANIGVGQCISSNNSIHGLSANLTNFPTISTGIVYWNGSLGNEEAFIKFTSTILETSFNNIKNKPTTLEGYGITDGADKSKLDVIEERIENNLENLIYVPNGYDNTSIGENELYVGVQKSLSAEGGGTIENPMSYNNSLLDIVTYIDKYTIQWNDTSNNISTRDWSSICYGNDKYVAVSGGYNGSNTFAYSTDGINWVETSHGLNNRDWSSICYGNDKYVAVATNSNTFAYSSDGIHWTETTNVLNNRQWLGICYGNGKYVVVSFSNTFAYSSDGITWIETSNGINDRSWSSICYGNDKYVAVSMNTSKTFAYSSDGIHWTETTNGLSNREWYSICYGNGKYVAISGYGRSLSNTFAYSSDGINWTETNTTLTENAWNSICYTNKHYVAIASYNSLFAYSTDGITWTEVPNNFSNSYNYRLCYHDMHFVIISGQSNIFKYSMIINNIIDKFAHLPEKNDIIKIKNYFMTQSVNISSIFYGNGKYIGLNSFNSLNGSRIIYYSIDGINWYECNPLKSNTVWHDGCYGNGKYIIISIGTYGTDYSDNVFAYSTDGINWTETSNGLSNQPWKSICYGNGKFVAIVGRYDASNTVAYSTDGINWTEINTGLSSKLWYSICYGNGKYVAVATSSNIFIYSTDGITWTETSNGLSNRNWYSICYGNGKYVAVANSSNTFAYSTDGITWTETSEGLSNRKWRSICYGNGKYVAVSGNDGNNNVAFAYSTDGITWTETSEGLSNGSWSSICYGNGKYVAVSPILSFKTITNLYFLETPKTIGGFAKFSTTYTKDDYFSTLYQTDEENPKYTSDGLGMMIKVDTTQNNIICDKTYNIGDKTIKLLIGYDIEKGLYFKTEMGETVKSLNSMYDVLMRVGDPLLALLNGYKDKLKPISIIKWAETTNGLSSRNWTSICYGNGKYVATSGGYSNGSNTFAYSTDGINWTETTNGLSSRNWTSICYGNGKYVAIQINGGYNITSNTFAYSTDGITWTETSHGLNHLGWQRICYGNGKYVIIISTTNTFAYSTDGINWTESSNGLSGRDWQSICYGNGKYVAITGSGSGSNIFAYSNDGITWTEISNGLNSRRWYFIYYGNKKYIAAAYNSNTFAYSTDGINWTETTNGLSTRGWFSICYNDKEYIAIADSSNIFAYSTDGITWTEISNGLSKRTLSSICYGKDKSVVISVSSNTFAYSL